VAGAGGFELIDGELEVWRFSPVREKPQNLFPLSLVSNSKRLNFENRTESVESRASERNGPFGENKPALPIRGPEPRLEIAAATGLNCQQIEPENIQPWLNWRSERDSNARYGSR
jgi:hypothetical protein